MTKVCITGVYFGSLPNYFDLWLKSAAANPTIDFLIFTDQERDDLPSNVRFVKFTLSEMQRLASEKLGFEACLPHPYKCCDYKAIYGFIFDEYLNGYDYWGHCDFDLIWGDLRGFFDRYHLENYDKFLPLGHLSLYRNTPENNRRFMLDGAPYGYREVFTNEKGYAFDETSEIALIYRKHGFSYLNERIFADISVIYHRFKLALDDKNYDYQVFAWNDGHVYRYYDGFGIKKDEFIYVHFKERGFLPVEDALVGKSAFLVTNKGFVGYDPDNVSLETIVEYNPFPGTQFEAKELKAFTAGKRRARLSTYFLRLFRVRRR